MSKNGSDCHRVDKIPQNLKYDNQSRTRIVVGDAGGGEGDDGWFSPKSSQTELTQSLTKLRPLLLSKTKEDRLLNRSTTRNEGDVIHIN